MVAKLGIIALVLLGMAAIFIAIIGAISNDILKQDEERDRI